MLGSEKEIINELKFCLKMLETEKNRDIKFSLYSYIENLEGVLKNLGSDFKIKRKDILKTLSKISPNSCIKLKDNYVIKNQILVESSEKSYENIINNFSYRNNFFLLYNIRLISQN